MRNLALLCVLMLPFTLHAQEDLNGTGQFLNKLDIKIPQVLQDFAVPGAAVAIIEDGEIVMQKCYGFADLDKKIKVTDQTGFNIGSISKTVAAWGVMKLVHEGKIDLDVPAEQYLTRWHLPESEFNSDSVTIRRLLSHTAGLSLHGYPGWSPDDELPTIEESLNGRNNGPGRVEIIMEPGSQYKYSGGGYTMLQLIIEEVTGQKFEDYMQAQILDPLGMTNSSYKIDDKVLAGSAAEYDNYGDAIDFELFTAQAAAGLHTTLEDFTHLAFASMYRNKDREKYSAIIPDRMFQQMMEAVPQASGFFGYGMGYQVDHVYGLDLSGHGGNNTGWHALFRVNPASSDGFLVLTNGGGGNTLCYQVYCDWVLWKTGDYLGDWCQATPSISTKLKNVIDHQGIDGITEVYAQLKENEPYSYNFAEDQLNNLGYYYLGKEDVETALAIFKLNVDAFPYAFNVYDSYGEALLARGNREEAIANYKKSVGLNPDNEHGIQVLKDLGESTDDLLFKVTPEHLERLAGKYVATHDQGWRITVEVDNGVLKCGDKHYPEFTLVPIGEDKFVNPRFGALWRFDTTDPDADPVMHFGKRTFKKVQ